MADTIVQYFKMADGKIASIALTNEAKTTMQTELQNVLTTNLTQTLENYIDTVMIDTILTKLQNTGIYAHHVSIQTESNIQAIYENNLSGTPKYTDDSGLQVFLSYVMINTSEDAIEEIAQLYDKFGITDDLNDSFPAIAWSGPWLIIKNSDAQIIFNSYADSMRFYNADNGTQYWNILFHDNDNQDYHYLIPLNECAFQEINDTKETVQIS